GWGWFIFHDATVASPSAASPFLTRSLAERESVQGLRRSRLAARRAGSFTPRRSQAIGVGTSQNFGSGCAGLRQTRPTDRLLDTAAGGEKCRLEMERLTVCELPRELAALDFRP